MTSMQDIAIESEVETGKLYAFDGKSPVVHSSVFLAAGARVIGDVEIAEGCSVWFNAVVRGDVERVRIGKHTNIQDNAVIHVTHFADPTEVGERVTVGHAAVLHGCTIKDGALIGMNAVVLDRAVIGAGSLVAAGAMVRPGTKNWGRSSDRWSAGEDHSGVNRRRALDGRRGSRQLYDVREAL